MRTNTILLKFLLIALLGTICFKTYTQENKETLLCKNAIKLDLVPFYFDFFDNRKQIRTGFEYERYLQQKTFAACYLDMGLYDDYTYKKYYDFFNQNQGIYSIEQDVSIKGFHLMPSYNYYFKLSKKKPHQGIFAGGIMDFSYYRKKLDYFNSQTLEKTSDKYNQKKLGIGLHAGAKYSFDSHLFVELETSIFTAIFNHVSDKDVNKIKSLNAQWVNSNHNLWWVSNIKIGYAF